MSTFFKIQLVIIAGLFFFVTIVSGYKNTTPFLSFYSAPKKCAPVITTVKSQSAPENKINVYLTIDDGPSPASFFLSNTTLSDSIFIAMFVIGDSVFKNSSNKIFFDLYQLNPFIEIGNHSYSHANGHYHQYYQNATEVLKDFTKNEDSLHISNKIARLPGRNTWRVNGRKKTDLPDDSSSADGLAKSGYRVFGWDIEWKYTQDTLRGLESPEKLIASIARLAKNHKSFTNGNIVVLCHESMFISPFNRMQFIKLVTQIKKNRSYQLKALSQYPTG